MLLGMQRLSMVKVYLMLDTIALYRAHFRRKYLISQRKQKQVYHLTFFQIRYGPLFLELIHLDFNPHHQTATINHDTSRIYYLGGSTTTSKWEQIKIPFNWVLVFDTASATWSNETLGGVIPDPRIYHTANLRM